MSIFDSYNNAHNSFGIATDNTAGLIWHDSARSAIHIDSEAQKRSLDAQMMQKPQWAVIQPADNEKLLLLEDV